MAYGEHADVAALTKRWTNAGSFDDTTIPTSTQVSTMLTRISAMIDTYLAGLGFSTPVTTPATAVSALEEITIGAVADLVMAANSAGRFYTSKNLRGKSPFVQLRRELKEWCIDAAPGFESLGVERGVTSAENIAFRDGDEGGDDVTPIFQRKGFGDTRNEWDS